MRTAFFFGAAFLATGVAIFLAGAFVGVTFFFGAAFFGAAFLGAAFFTAFLTAFFGAAFFTAFFGAAFLTAFFGAAFFTVRFVAICASFNAEDTFGRVAGAIIAQVPRGARAFEDGDGPYAMLRLGMRALRRDPFVLSAAAAVVVLSLVSLVFPVSREVVEEIGWWADFALVALAIVCAWLASRAESTTWGRRFWKLVTISFCLWFLVLLDWQFSWGRQLPFEGGVVADFLFLGYYFGLLLATAVKPHERGAPTRLSPILSTEVAAGALLAFGLLGYFVILPSRLTPKAYETFVPSLSLYVLLDLVLVIRVGWWCRVSRRSVWRTSYCALLAAFTFTGLHDVHELRVYTEGQALQTSAWDLVWWAQFLALTIAARASAHRAPGAETGVAGASSPDPIGRQAAIGPVASYAFILPVIHLGGRLMGLLDPALDRPRETLVLACAVVLGGLAIVHQQLLNHRHRVLSQRLHDAQILLQQSRKMEALGRLAGGVAHGFNNMLSVIVGYSEICWTGLGPGDRMLDPLQQIRFAAERASTLTRQLATFSRGRLDRETALELDRAIGAMMPTLRRLLTERVELTFEPGGREAWITVDPDQFERALVNIVANGRDAMPEEAASGLRPGPSSWQTVTLVARLVAAGPVRGNRGHRQRDRDGRGYQGQVVRAVLHHEARRRTQGAGAADRLRGRAPGERAHRGGQRAGRRDDGPALPAFASAAGGGGEAGRIDGRRRPAFHDPAG